MKTIVIIIKHIFVPFSAFLFLIIGLLACFFSAVIEFFVLKEIISIPDLGFNANYCAAILVFVLEGSKYTLHFYGESLKRAGIDSEIKDFDVNRKRKLIVLVKSILVFLSLVCSIIFIVNILYNDSSVKIEAAIEENDKKCQERFQEEVAQLDLRNEKRIVDEIAKYDTEKAHIETQQFQLDQILEAIKNETYIQRRQDLQEEADAMRTSLTNLQNSYTTHIKEINEKVYAEYKISYEALESKYGVNGSERIKPSDTEVLVKGDNLYLSNFLLAFTKTFFNQAYSRVTYFICSIIIGLIVSIVLELCISISQNLLTISVDSFIKILGYIPKLEKGKKFVRITIWLLFSVFIATAIYLIASIILNVDRNSNNINIVLITYVGTVLLVNVLSPKNTSGGLLSYLSTINHKTAPLINCIKEILSDAIIPAALAFVGYMIIGFCFNGEFIYGDLNGLAIAIGGAFAKTFKFGQCDFSI